MGRFLDLVRYGKNGPPRDDPDETEDPMDAGLRQSRLGRAWIRYEAIRTALFVLVISVLIIGAFARWLVGNW